MNAQSIAIATPGHTVDIAISNHNILRTTDRSLYLNDYEKKTAYYTYTRRTGSTTLQFKLPYHHMHGGQFDTFISDWHKRFNFENANRDQLPEYNTRIEYRQNGTTHLAINGAQYGFGDATIMASRTWNSSSTQWSPMAILSLPTGDENKYLGLGRHWMGIGLNIHRPTQWGYLFTNATIFEQKTTHHFKEFNQDQPFQFDIGVEFPIFKQRTTHTLSVYKSPIGNTGIAEIDAAASSTMPHGNFAF